MGVRRLRLGRRVITWAVGLGLVAAIGCSQQEELTLDPGVSPFYPGEKGSSPVPAGRGASGQPAAGSPAVAGPADAPTGAGSLDSPVTEAPLRPEDVERQLRIALRAAEKGDSARASRLLDRILALEPLNREALIGRAAIALDQSQQATAAPERAAALEKALGLVRTLRRASEKSTKRETELVGRAFYAEAQWESSQGRQDRALSALKEAYDTGSDLFDRVENDPSLAALRASTAYRGLVQGIDAANLEKARGRAKGHLDHPIPMAFDFTLPGLDGKPVALGQLKGRVVLVDLWGTWCKPCLAAIPGLIQLYRKHHRHGLEIVGLSYEQNAPDPVTAVQMVKQFVRQAGIPYTCAMGDQATLEKIPDFKGFPTSILIDRSGKVRVLVTENSGGTIESLDDPITVLLAEPGSPAGNTSQAAKPR
jgi:thiol-disulfide isomerase/thioredoxin